MMLNSSFWKRSAILAFCALSILPASAVTAYGLTDENDLVTFDTSTPGNLIGGGAILGLGGQDLIGIDFRPSNGLLYGVGNLGGIFTINTTSRQATLVSTLSTQLQGSRFGVDFNPVADRLRITSDVDQNLRVNVATGAAIVDGTLSYASGVNPGLTASAYTNSFAGATTTTLYGIDFSGSNDQLVIQSPPNNGTLTAVGPLGINASALSGFDIYGTVGYAAMQETGSGISGLYTINLQTGAASLVGTIGAGDLFDGLTVAPVPEPTSMIGLAVGGLCLLKRRRK